MYNDAKKASNNRYLSQFRTISVRMKHAEAEELDGKAAEAGESVAAYMLHACRDRMTHAAYIHADVATGDGLLLDAETTGQAERAAEATGEAVTDWIKRAIRETATADARVRELRGLRKGE